MNATKILWGQVLLVGTVVLAFVWAATEWVACRLGFQPQLGRPWFELIGWPIYQPPAFFWWWFAYDAYARPIFVEGAYIAASGGIAAVVVAVAMSVWRAREVKKVTTYGSARWAETREVRRAGLLRADGVMLGRWRGAYLRHHGPEHVLCFAPTRSGKGVGLVVPTLLTWPGSAIVHDIKGENWTLTAGWRARFGRVLLFDPTNANSAAYNPLLEVRRGEWEVRDVQNIADVLVDPRRYNALCDYFHSSAVKLDQLTALWTSLVLRLLPQALRVNGRYVLVGDGIKIPKCGRKMPAVKLLHQQSESNTKPDYITGHSLQAVSLLVQAASSVFAMPLAARIHEGLVWSNRDRRTLLDKMISLIGITDVDQPFYFVADAYYGAQKIIAGLLKQNNHLVTRVKSNAVAYTAYQHRGPRKRGAPRKYGKKLKVKSLLSDPTAFQKANSPVYGENKVTIQYRVRDLLWRPAGRMVRFVAVIHPTRGSLLLMCTDTSLDAIDIIRLYGLRFKIELSFKQAVHQIGTFAYHFWMFDMKARRRNDGNQHLHRASSKYRDDVKRKLHAYHVFIQTGLICQGLLQYLSVAHPRLVWASFGSCLRTVRPGIPPSELVVATALRQRLPEFLLDTPKDHIFTKFLAKRADTNKMQGFQLAA